MLLNWRVNIWFFFLIFTLLYFTILYWFCHTLTWIHHGYIQLPNLESPSHLMFLKCCCCSVAQSRPSLCGPWTAPGQASLSFKSLRACSKSSPLSQWCHPTIPSSDIPFSSCLQSFPASKSTVYTDIEYYVVCLKLKYCYMSTIP